MLKFAKKSKTIFNGLIPRFFSSEPPKSEKETLNVTHPNLETQIHQNVQTQPEKLIFVTQNTITLNEDEEEEVVINEENQKLANHLAFKALLYATLINIAAAILFVLVMRYYYDFKTIKEFKTALDSKIQIFKSKVKEPINNFQKEATEEIQTFKKNNFGDSEIEKNEKTVSKVKGIFEKNEKEQ